MTTLIVPPDRPGSLACFLQIPEEKQNQLTKIESRPFTSGGRIKFRNVVLLSRIGHIDEHDAGN